MANLTEKQDKFCDLMAEGGLSKTEAYRKAGYKAGKSVSQNAYALYKDLAGEIANRVKIRLASHAPEMLKELLLLATSAQTENVRLAAIKDVLDRAGYKPVEQREELAPTRDRAALEAELESLVGKERTAEFMEGVKGDPVPPLPEDTGKAETPELPN